LLPGWRDTEYEPKRFFVARVDGCMVCRAIYETRSGGASAVAWVSIEVLREHRNIGIGTAMLERLENLARAAAIEHVPTGRLAGYTELSVPPELARAVSQEDTIVLREHRGHRLGMLLKVANLVFLSHTYPGHPSVTTFNAEENLHMLSVNEAVGFVPVAYEGGWKKVLD
jgi:GNAT superfamily N-acetyltransferase